MKITDLLNETKKILKKTKITIDKKTRLVTIKTDKHKLVFEAGDFSRLQNLPGTYTTKFSKEQWISSVERTSTINTYILTRKGESIVFNSNHIPKG